MAPDDCRARGVEQAALIVKELRAGRPVSVAMQIGGLEAWHTMGSSNAYHAFLITGVHGNVFQTRNSWEGLNPEVSADQLCRVDRVTSVLVPGER